MAAEEVTRRRADSDANWDAHLRLLDHPVVQSYVSQNAFGQLSGPLQAITSEVRARTTAGARVLVPCYGGVQNPLAVARALPERLFEVVHLSSDAVKELDRRAAEHGLRNLTARCADPSQTEFDARSFDVLLGLDALHHIAPQPQFWQRCRSLLRPGGAVLAQEYIGPSGLRWAPQQHSAAQEALDRHLPPSLQGVAGVVSLDAAGPLPDGHSAGSAELLAACEAAGFEISGRADAGCGLLVPVLLGRIDHFDRTDWRHNRVLAALFREEQALMADGSLGSDYSLFAAKPR